MSINVRFHQDVWKSLYTVPRGKVKENRRLSLCVISLVVEQDVANKKNPLVLFESPQNTERQFLIASDEIAKI